MNHPDTFVGRGGVLLACLAVVALSMLLWSCVRAGEAVLGCPNGPPTQNIDGTALTDLVGFQWYASTRPDSLMPVGKSKACAFVVEGLPSGETWYFAATSLAGGTLEAPRVEGPRSEVASKFIAPTPQPVLTLKTIETQAYYIISSMAKLKFFRSKLPIGAIQKGLPCQQDIVTHDGYHKINTEPMTFSGKRYTTVVARCGMMP